MKAPDEMPIKDLNSEPQKKKRKGRYIPKVKICAACGSFAHGNQGHDIMI